jgi:hypothetical protein
VPEDSASVTSVDSDSNSRHEAAHIAPQASFAELTRAPSNNAHKLAVLSYEGNFSSRVSPPPRAWQLQRVRTRYGVSAHAPWTTARKCAAQLMDLVRRISSKGKSNVESALDSCVCGAGASSSTGGAADPQAE